MIITIALVPHEKIDNLIKSSFNIPDENVEELLNYVERNWISNTRPIFDREVCC